MNFTSHRMGANNNMNSIDDFNEEELIGQLREILDDERFEHTMNVRDYALKLARGLDIKKQRIIAAALLHDIAKGMENEEMIHYAASHGIPLTPGQLVNTKTLHQSVGAEVARNQFGIDDGAVLSAISKHATADAYMSQLDIIIYLADSLEENRDYEGVEEIRGIASHDLDEAFYQVLRRTMIYVLERGLYLDERSLKAYNAACIKRAEKGKGTPRETDSSVKDALDYGLPPGDND
jgi:predicted HD superfamily hydrolase involved in NAD metabolism